MNDQTVKTTKEFVFQRLTEPFPFSDDKTTPLFLALGVAGVLLLFAFLSFGIPLLRTLKWRLSGVLLRGVAWFAVATAVGVTWLGMSNAVDRDQTDMQVQIFLSMLAVQGVVAGLFGVSTLATLIHGSKPADDERKLKGVWGGVVGVAGGLAGSFVGSTLAYLAAAAAGADSPLAGFITTRLAVAAVGVLAGAVAGIYVARFLVELLMGRYCTGNTDGLVFGTVLTVLFGRLESGPLSWWHLFAAGYRALLFLIPLACLGIARGFETDPEPVWVLFTGGMLATACNLTLHMYLKDSGEARWWGGPVLFLLILSPLVLSPVIAGLFVLLVVVVRKMRESVFGAWLKVAPLAVLRCLTLAALAFCFLLPAMQPWETSEKRSKVVVLLDVSPSMTKWSDEINRDPNAKLKTRADKVLDFLTSEDGKFVADLLAKNPVTVYRFGAGLDADPEVIARGGNDKPDQFNWKRDEWEQFVNYDFKAWVLRYKAPDGTGLSGEAKEALKAAPAWAAGTGDSQWALDWAKADEANSGAVGLAELPNDTDEVKARKATDRKLLTALREKVAKRVDAARLIAQGSAVPDSVTAALNREQANMTQAVIVFTDGRSNMSSDQAVAETARRAKEANIPVYTVAVGSAREVVSLVISDLQAPDRTQPDEPTQVTVAADGVGFKQGDQVEATLELFLPGKDPKTDPADYEMKQTITFGAGETPHGETTFVLDAEEFAKKAALTLVEEISPPKPGRKWQLKKGQWKVRAKLPVDPREIFRDPVHLSPVRTMEVMDKPLRVLLAASAPSREYQILRQLLVREVEQKRAELSIYMQNEGGQKGTIVQDVPPGRLLLKFPDEFDVSKDTSVGTGGDPGSDAETMRQRAKYNNLNEYDLIICFDPNWNERDDANAFRIPNTAFTKLKAWSQDYGGGLIYVAGPFYTASMVRQNEEAGRLKPLLDLMPVEPDDIVASDDPLIRISGRKTARRLKFNPPKDSELLRLDDFTPQRDDAAKAVAGWELFFTGLDVPPKKTEREYLEPKRGFFTYYPVKKVKPLAASIAEFLNVDEKGQEAPRPFIAVGPSGAGRTAWVGSGEIFRLRATPEVGITFYDKFWMQLARYCSAKRTSGSKARGDVLMSKEVIAGQPIRVRTRVMQSSGEPYPENDLDKPKLTIEKLDQNGEVKERFGPFDVLKPAKLGQKFEGYYQGVVMPDPAKMTPGEFRYRVSVTKSDLPEPLTAEFLLRSANPELDNTKPDLQALRDMASPVKAALDTEPDPAKRSAFAARLGVSDDDVKTGKAKLAFALDSQEKLKIIPELVRSRSESPQNRGVVDPLWDDSYDPAADRRTAWLRGESFPDNPLRMELLRFTVGSNADGSPNQLVLRLWMAVLLGLLILIGLTLLLQKLADKSRLGVGVAIGATVLVFFTCWPLVLLGVLGVIVSGWRGPLTRVMLALSALWLLLNAELAVILGTNLPIGAWVPAVMVYQAAIAFAWFLRTRSDLPKGGVLGVLEGVATGLVGVLFIPTGLTLAVYPLAGLYEQVLGPLPEVALWAVWGVCGLSAVGLVGVYAFAGKHRPAVGSIVLTLAMLSQALAAALVVWNGNPFPVGYAVLALAALLCTEWTVRKLIRLA